MKILGIKLTHDGALALIENGKLVFSIEMEKINNYPRYSSFCIDMAKIEEILKAYGYQLNEMDSIVVDGWDTWDPALISSGHVAKTKYLSIPSFGTDEFKFYELAGYGRMVTPEENVLERQEFKTAGVELSYVSYQHVSSHILGAYCTSPFARNKEDSFILIWDGGMPPQLFYYVYREKKVRNLGYLFPLVGYLYINFAQAFAPFNAFRKDLSIAGKMMAYIAIGKFDQSLLEKLREIYTGILNEVKEINMDIDLMAILTETFIKEAKQLSQVEDISHDDMLTTFHFFVQELLLETLKDKLKDFSDLTPNLCFAGGSALNIKWNSNIRNSGLFNDIWVPPFPNDSGSAIGTACCEMIEKDDIISLDWTVYCGPALIDKPFENQDYAVSDCNLEELANILHKYNEPVVYLNGFAESGPRSLGNRSILAAPVSGDMKSRINAMKGREDYRPVAPICIEEAAPSIFNPGSADPYMLFEHKVKESWIDKIPAIIHLDGTARLQTVNATQNPEIYQLLSYYEKLSGVPLLCNTSANLNGSGFFADVKSVMDWGKAVFIWNEGKLYTHKKHEHYESRSEALALDPNALGHL